METLKIGMDSGKSATKFAVFQDKAFAVGSLPTTAQPAGRTKEGLDYLLCEGTLWEVGDPEAVTPNATQTTKITMTHKVCVLAAICRVMKESGKAQRVRCAINLPLEEFADNQRRALCHQFYSGFHELAYNGEPFAFSLEAEPYYEGMGIYLRHHQQIGNQEALVLDLGSWNVNGIFIRGDGIPSKRRSFSLDLGVERLLVRVAHAARHHRQDFSLMSPGNARKLLAEGLPFFANEAMKAAAGAEVQLFLGELRAEIENRGLVLADVRVVFGGGGAALLQPYLGSVFGKEAVVSIGIHDNAKGSLAALE